jgi:beta-lactamase regulating signal transducer with metallopeptidase domain
MTGFAALAGSAEVHALGWALLHFSWQGALIALALRSTLHVMPRAHASARYAACCAALTCMLLAPLATFWRLLGSDLPTLRAEPLLSDPTARSTWFFASLVAVWALGSAAMTLRVVFGVTRLRGLVRRAGVLDGHWQWRLTILARQMGLGARVRLLESSEVDAPLMMGWLRPVILVPVSALTSLPAAYVEALFLHELAHARRLDYLANILQSCIEALLFYHPAVHWVSACMRVERECCCDDLAIQVTGDPLGYARALTALEENLQSPAIEPALASTGGSLLSRIERIARVRRAAITAPRSWIAVAVLASTVCLSAAGVWSCTSTDHAVSSDPTLDIEWLPPALEPWKPALADAAHRHGLSPALLAIVTLVESLGDPGAHSPGGAVGLMQLMPSTAAQIAVQRQLADYSEARLWEPGYNIDLGAWYLSEQLNAFGAERSDAESIARAAIAYNAGPAIARAYFDGLRELPDETRRYRDLVVGMWTEREQEHSATFATWRERAQRAARALQ